MSRFSKDSITDYINHFVIAKYTSTYKIARSRASEHAWGMNVNCVYILLISAYYLKFY